MDLWLKTTCTAKWLVEFIAKGEHQNPELVGFPFELPFPEQEGII